MTALLMLRSWKNNVFDANVRFGADQTQRTEFNGKEGVVGMMQSRSRCWRGKWSHHLVQPAAYFFAGDHSRQSNRKRGPGSPVDVGSCEGFSDACITKQSTRFRGRRARSAKVRNRRPEGARFRRCDLGI